MNLGPSPSYARNVNLVLNLTTGLVSPQFHCRFDDFFQTTHLSTRDADVLSSWKQLAGCVKYDGTPVHSERLARSRNQRVGPIETTTPTAPSSVAQEEVSFTDDISTESSDMPVSEGASQPADQPSTSAGVNSRGRARTMSRAMQHSVSQWSFYGETDMHYMQAMPAVTVEEAEFEFAHDHDFHLDLQDGMRSPIAFHAEMMGDIMYFHQAMQQDDADEFVKAVAKEVNGHIDHNRWELI
jgi:hypothetical protein